MRIGIDCRTMLNPEEGEKAGVGHYTTHLVLEMVKYAREDELVLFFDDRTPGQATMAKLEKEPHVTVVRMPYGKYKQYLPLIYSHWLVPRVLNKYHLDVFHAPAYVSPLLYKGKTVVTIHDLAIYKHPEWFPKNQNFSTKVLVPRSIQQATRVIAVSNSTARTLHRTFDFALPQVHVVYEGATVQEHVSQDYMQQVRKKFSLSDEYILFVGTIEPRKNLKRLVKAFDKYMDENAFRHKDFQLVIAGAKGWNYGPVVEAISLSKWSKHIVLTGYVSDDEKRALLQDCKFFVFPSLWEGFGLPVLEAAAFGVPVLTSKISSLPEVVGFGAQYIDPHNVTSIQQGIHELMLSQERRTQLAERAAKHAADFTWERTAHETYEVYKQAAEDV